MQIKKHKNKIIAGVVISALLAFTYWWGGGAPGLRGWETPAAEESVDAGLTPAPAQEQVPETALPPETAEPQKTPEAAEANDNQQTIKKPGEEATEENRPEKADNTPMTAKEKIEWAKQMAESLPQKPEPDGKMNSYDSGAHTNAQSGESVGQTAPVPEEQPEPMEPQGASVSDKEHTCTLSVRCDTILANIAWLDKEKTELVPKNGVIFPEKTVTFYEGESVFNLLLREMKQNKIHMEYTNVPVYNSAYIEGINNLYELDCGELSGWMYKVNGWFPGYGSSRYQLQEGDKVEWVYTCDLGIDIGGYYAKMNGK